MLEDDRVVRALKGGLFAVVRPRRPGCDEAFDNADILVMDEKIGKLPIAVKAARFTQLVVKENTGLALIAKFALLAGSALGFVPIAAAAAVDSGVVILSLINSLRALGSWKE